MAHMHIKQIADNRYAVRQYDDVLSVELGEMSGKKLDEHLSVRDLILCTPENVLQSLRVGEEITVQFSNTRANGAARTRAVQFLNTLENMAR
jgi:hypothetical protein